MDSAAPMTGASASLDSTASVPGVVGLGRFRRCRPGQGISGTAGAAPGSVRAAEKAGEDGGTPAGRWESVRTRPVRSPLLTHQTAIGGAGCSSGGCHQTAGLSLRRERAGRELRERHVGWCDGCGQAGSGRPAAGRVRAALGPAPSGRPRPGRRPARRRPAAEQPAAAGSAVSGWRRGANSRRLGELGLGVGRVVVRRWPRRVQPGQPSGCLPTTGTGGLGGRRGGRHGQRQGLLGGRRRRFGGRSDRLGRGLGDEDGRDLDQTGRGRVGHRVAEIAEEPLGRLAGDEGVLEVRGHDHRHVGSVGCMSGPSSTQARAARGFPDG